VLRRVRLGEFPGALGRSLGPRGYIRRGCALDVCHQQRKPCGADVSFPSAGDTARRAKIGFARHPVIRRQRKERRPLPAVELRSCRVSSTVMRCMRCSKRSEPNGSRPDRSADWRETCGGRTPLERVAVGSGKSASDCGICDLRIALHWQRNLGSRVVLPSKAGPHTYALCQTV